MPRRAARRAATRRAASRRTAPSPNLQISDLSVALWKNYANPKDNPVNMRLDNKLMEFRRPTHTHELPASTSDTTPVRKLVERGKCSRKTGEADEPVPLGESSFSSS